MLAAKLSAAFAILLVIALALTGGAYLRGTQATQTPKLSVDMVTAGTSYDVNSNAMTVGNIDNCLSTAAPGNNSLHSHVVHLVVQDVEDMVGWQARLNYSGDKARPASVDFIPFQGVSFVNLPIDAVTSEHRQVFGVTDIPPAAAGPQTALIGSTYTGENSLAVSPDTPPKDVPDDTSYSAPSGGVLAAVTVQVPAGNAGNPLLTLDLDDDSPNAPGSTAVIFNGNGIETTALEDSALSDGVHAEGTPCLPQLP